MGTTFTVKIAGPRLPERAAEAARNAVADALDGVVAKMSTYLPDSELSRFNRHADGTPYALSTDTLAVFALAREVSARLGRRIRHHDRAGRRRVGLRAEQGATASSPTRTSRRSRRTSAGASSRWTPSAGTATKAHPDLRADLSGIAKGFGVDQAARALEALGIADYMIEAGGEVRTRGLNGEGRPWQIAIERPDAMPQRPHFVVPLSGLSMATSGDYRIYFEQDGRRYSHEIDPATGRPIGRGLASVSVVAPECGYADAMATALIVLGPDKGYALASAQNIAAHFIARAPDGSLHDRQTPAFAALGGRPVAAA